MIRRSALAFAFAAASLTSLAVPAVANEPAKAAPPAAAAPAAPVPAPAPAGWDAAKGQVIASGVCAACHMADGNSVIPLNPILAGQGKDYIYKQLTNFKMTEGKPPVRMNPVMMAMTMPLSDEDMKNAAAYFSKQNPKGAAVKDAALAATGKKLWVSGDLVRGIPACAGCHGHAGAGLPAQYPRLAGQHPEYTEAQLKAFRDGTRSNDAEKVMRMIAGKMNDADIKAISEYATSLR